MIVGFHPVADNPVRMGYVPGCNSVSALIERLGDLEYAVGEGRLVPAPWEPYYHECPSCRFAAAYAWARSQLADPLACAVALALFPGEAEQLATRIGHANWLILCAKAEPSRITRQLMLTEAFELWQGYASDWLQQIVRNCAALGIETSVASLRQAVRQTLQPLAKEVSVEADAPALPAPPAGASQSHGFDKTLLQMDGWTPDPGPVILPVDSKTYSLAREILLLDLQNVVLLRARRSVRTVPWDKVSLVHLFNETVTFEISGQPPLVVAGYEHPQDILKIVQERHRAATERILQGLATRVLHRAP